MLTVVKFGGTSLADNACLENAARIVEGLYNNANSVICVVSAQGKMTDGLISNMNAIKGKIPEREYDAYIATGEQMSAALLCMHLNAIGVPCVSLCGFQAGIVTNSVHKDAEILRISTDRIIKELENNRVAVVCGFQGISEQGDITTLGRGGSDTSAIALACAFCADECIIYTDVEGVYSADPKRIENAVLHRSVSFDEMLQMSSLGAHVMHDKSVATAKRYNVPFSVRSSKKTSTSGTDIYEFHDINRVCSVVCGGDFVLYHLKGIEDMECTLTYLDNNKFELMQYHDAENGLVCSAKGSRGVDEQLKSLCGELICYENMTRVSVVGTGLCALGVPTSLALCLKDGGLSPLFISASEAVVSAMIDKDSCRHAEHILCEKYF